jgi:hypothetical protein
LAILGQKSLDRLKIQSQFKIKNTPPFCLKRTKGKTEYEKNHNYFPLKSQQDKGKQNKNKKKIKKNKKK